MLKTVKFGGSSLADAPQFEQVRDIVRADDSRRIVVVSAPGKRYKGDNKVTDLLYLLSAHIRYGVDYNGLMDKIQGRYQSIAQGLGLDFDVAAAFEDIRARLAGGPDEAYLVSRGEALCAQLMASYLGFDYIDAAQVICLSYDGQIDLAASSAKLADAYARSSGWVVLPGFYGMGPNQRLQLMSRGGSDITGAAAAAALGCQLYENWTDVPGILMADPGIVQEPKPIPSITYEELHELTCMGAQVLHEASVFPVRQAGIPINIRDTGNPSAPGTVISDSPVDNVGDEVTFITGVTGRKGYCILDVYNTRHMPVTDFTKSVIDLLAQKGIAAEQMMSGQGRFSLIIHGESGSLYPVISELETLLGPDSVQLTDGIAMIACVGRKMVFRPGIAGQLFAALGENSVNIRVIVQRPQEITIMVGVAEADFEKAIQVVYLGFARKLRPLSQ